MKVILKYLIFVSILGFFAACSPWEEHITVDGLRGETLFQQLSENPKTTTFAAIVKKVGYDSLLNGDQMLTVFAPTNTALASVNTDDTKAMLQLVKNHIAYSEYTIQEGGFNVGKVEMINAKNITINGLKLNGAGLNNTEGNYNIAVENGVIHLMDDTIPFQKNIYEYLKSQTGSLQTAFIQNQDKLIMDMEKSVQTGVNSDGKPVYDTVWINQNKFLENYPINDESKNFTYVLLPNNVIERIETKYSKYFVKPIASEQDSIVRSEFIKDCILAPVEITSNGKYISIDGVNMDINASNIEEVYKASNGLIYKLSDADVKIYENKLKTIIIQAENYDEKYSNNTDAWSIRQNSVFSGGKDVLLNSRTQFISKSDTDSIVYNNIYYYPSSGVTYTGGIASNNNSYLEFNPTINSVTYQIYWSAYDNIDWHYTNSNTREPVKFSEKMLISFPEADTVYRDSYATIRNNFSLTTAFTSTRFTAGVQEEKQLYRCYLSTLDVDAPYFILSRNYAYTSEDNYFNFYDTTDEFGDKENLICPTYGRATILVCNTSEYKTTYAGPILLDYIKLVPQVDPND